MKARTKPGSRGVCEPQRTPAWAVVLATAAALLATGCTKEPGVPKVQKFSETREVMGTLATITAVCGKGVDVPRAFDRAFSVLDSVEALMSAHREDTEIARVNAAAGGTPVPVSPWTVAVVESALAACKLSGGAFDVTVGPLVELWKASARAETLPSPEAIDRALALVGPSGVEIAAGPGGARVGLKRMGMRIDLGGIAKGFAIDRAVEALQAEGVEAGIVEVGGDLRCFGRIPRALIGAKATLPVRTRRLRKPRAGGSGFFPGLRRTKGVRLEDLTRWPIGLQSPFEDEGLLGKIRLGDQAVATSGHYRRFVEIGGHRFSHIIDPRSGQPVGHPASVSVLASSALIADALATALTVLGSEAGLAMVDTLEGIEALIVEGDPQRPTILKSSGFPPLEPLGASDGRSRDP